MDYKIEKKIPLPKKEKSCKYPFGSMKVGDSFLVDSEEYSRGLMSRIIQSAYYWVAWRKNNWKFTTRKTEDNFIRVWRIK